LILQKGAMRFASSGDARLSTPAAVIALHRGQVEVRIFGNDATQVRVLAGLARVEPRGGGEAANVPAGTLATIAAPTADVELEAGDSVEPDPTLEALAGASSLPTEGFGEDKPPPEPRNDTPAP